MGFAQFCERLLRLQIRAGLSRGRSSKAGLPCDELSHYLECPRATGAVKLLKHTGWSPLSFATLWSAHSAAVKRRPRSSIAWHELWKAADSIHRIRGQLS